MEGKSRLLQIMTKYFNSAAETEAKKARAENMKMSEIFCKEKGGE